MDLAIGSTIGDYQVLDVLGAGGMGSVYKVRNLISDRVEALKVLLPDLSGQPELAERFQREIKVQGSLEHPNIAQLRTAFRSGNQLLMVMEFVDGMTLEGMLHEGPLTVTQAIDAISQVLAALEFAHARGVIHRDIKPANMIMTRTGMLKLMDFGIAKAATDHKLTMTGTTMGSIYYMSPEQIQGSANLDARADLYSVGVTLYQLVTGKRPFDGDSQYAIMAAHLQTAPVPPVELDPRLPQALNDVILMSVTKDPNGRFQTAAAFRNALGGVASTIQGPTEPVAARAASAPGMGYAPSNIPPTQPLPNIPPTAALSSMPATQPPMPIPTAPAMQYAPPSAMPYAQPPAQYATPPAGAKSRHGLWMALGGIAAVLVAVAAIEFVPWRGAKANNSGQMVSTTPAAPASAQPAQPQVASATDGGASQPVEVLAHASPSSSAPAPSSPSPVSSRPSHPSGGGAPQVAPSQTTQPPTQQQQTAPPPVQQQAQAQPQAQPEPPQPKGPSRAEIMQAREHLAKLHVRADSIRSSLNSLRRSQQSMGMNLNAKFTGPEGLMNTYLKGANDAMDANDLAAARDMADKAEHQIEILEKLLNL